MLVWSPEPVLHRAVGSLSGCRPWVPCAHLAPSTRSWFRAKGFGDMLLSPIYCILCQSKISGCWFCFVLFCL